MKTRRTKMWRVWFGQVCSYDVVSQSLVTAIHKATNKFKRNHSFYEPPTRAELIGRA